MHYILIIENLPPRDEPYELTDAELGLHAMHIDDLTRHVLSNEGGNARFIALVDRYDILKQIGDNHGCTESNT